MAVRVASPPSAPSLRGSVASSIVGKTAEMVTLVLLATVVPRALGADAYGRFSVPLTVVTLGSLAMTLGGPTVLARFVPAAAPEHRLGLARAIGARLARGRAVQVAVVAALAMVAAIVAPESLPPAQTGLVVVALALNVAASIALQVGLGLGKTGAWSARFPLQNTVLVVAVLALHDRWALGATVAIVASAVAGAAFAAWVIVPVLRTPADPVPVPDGAIRFGVLQATGAALVQCSHRGGVLAVALLASSAAETGYTALATGIALGATYAVLQTFTVALPHVAGALDDLSPDRRDGEAVLRTLAGWLLVAIVPAVVLATLVLDTVVPAAFGDDYRDAVAAFGPALAVVVLAPLNALTVQIAALRMQPGSAAAGGVAAATAFVVVALATVPTCEAVGGTAATLAGAVASALVAIRLLPGAVGGRVAAASFGGVALVLVTAAWA